MVATRSSAGKDEKVVASKKPQSAEKKVKKREFNMKEEFPITNGILTFILLALIPWLFVSVLPKNSQDVTFAILLVAGVVGIQTCEFVGEIVGTYLTLGPLSGAPWNNPLKVNPKSKRRSKQMVKFKSQTWQLVCHAVMGALEWYVIQQSVSTSTGPTFLDEPSRMTLKLEENHPLVETVYILQMAIWIITGIFHVFFLEQNSDYLVMLGHHVATVALLGLSFQHNYVRFGICVLFVHDVSDVVIDLLKIFNYLDLSDLRCAFLVEICFVTNLWSWAYTRLWILPKYIIYEAGYKGWTCALALWKADGNETKANELIVQEQSCYYPDTNLNLKIMSQGLQDARSRGGSDPVTSILISGTIAMALLFVLVCMHMYWYALFLRLAKKIIETGGDTHEAGAEEYEGDDDDDEEVKED